MKGQQALMSSDKQDWGTPQAFIDWLQIAFNFKIDLDVCAHKGNNKCDTYFTIEDNCLEQDWFGKHAWMNPPFGRELPKFIDRAIEQVENGNVRNVWILVPARTDTQWAHRLCTSKVVHSIFFFKGRFNFDFERNLKHSNAPFPSMLVRLRMLSDHPDNIAVGQRREPVIRFLDIGKDARGY